MTEIKLEDRVWKQVKFKDIFDIKLLKGPNDKWIKNNSGVYPVISDQGVETQFAERYDIPGNKDYMTKRNCILIPTERRARGVSRLLFYMDKDFISGGRLVAVRSSSSKVRLNSTLAYFLIPLLTKIFEGYKKITEDVIKKIKEKDIYLPFNEKMIDTDFMQDYIESKVNDLNLEKNPLKELCISDMTLEDTKWKKFKFGEIFSEIKTGDGPKTGWVDENPGSIMVVSAKKLDHGVHGYSTPVDKATLYKGNCFTVSKSGGVGYMNYRDATEEFYLTSDAARVELNPKLDKILNKQIALFIVTVMRHFSGSRGDSLDKDWPVLLPVIDKDGIEEINWSFMEQLIKEIEGDKIESI